MSGSATQWQLGGFAAIIFSLYAKSISPSIAGGDSGELVAEGCLLGTAHPPGYPLFTMMVHLAMRLGQRLGFVDYVGEEPVNNVAFKMNVLSCLFTVSAAYLIGEMVQMAIPLYLEQQKGIKETPSPLFMGGSLLAMGLFSFSPLIWQYAVTAEVFPMNTYFSALIVYLVMRFSRTRRFGVALLGAFVCGLALCNQHTIILYEAPLILWMLFLLRNKLLSRGGYIPFIKLSAAFLVGLLPYIYLPLSANLLPENKSMSWGHVASLGGFLHHFLRRDYGTFQLFSGERGKNAEGFWVRSNAYLNDVYSVQGLYITPWLALLAVVCWRRLYFLQGGSSQPSREDSGSSPIKQRKVKNGNKKGDKKGSNGGVVGASGEKQKEAEEGEGNVSPVEANYTPLVLVATQIFYFLVFHNLANLPMGDKLLFGVHQRFWMQPNVVTFALCGVGFNEALRIVLRATGATSTAAGKGGARRKTYSRFSLFSTSPDDYLITPDNTGEESGAGAKGLAVGALGVVVALGLVVAQYQRNIFISDQADATYFRDYARAILSPLPLNSVLIINYDMQWTSVRYLTQCEGFRSDVTAINLSMMTYEWFYHKRELYPDLTFPGTFCAAPNSVAAVRGDVNHPGEFGFTLEQFFTANVMQRPIFLGGKVTHPDPKLDEGYDFVPVGLVSRVVPKQNRPDAATYRELTEKSWQSALSRMSRLPDLDKYTEETWEWTIGRDFKDRVTEVAAFALEGAIAAASAPIDADGGSGAGPDLAPLMDATYWIESTVILETLESNKTRAARLAASEEPTFGRGRVPTSVLKNAGLAHMQLVKVPATDDMAVLPLPSVDHFGTLRAMGWPVLPESARTDPDLQITDAQDAKALETLLRDKYGYDWKKWSADRFMEHWGKFLTREDAKRDPQYQTILDIYKAVDSVNKKRAAAQNQNQNQQQQQQQQAPAAKKRTKKGNKKAAAAP